MRRKNESGRFTAVDIFAGGGGLTVGLKRAGFRVTASVEIEKHAFSTYKTNHPDVTAFKQDIRTVSGQSLEATSPTGRIDLLVGCPPCQGFSSLTSKWRRNDPRNGLVAEMTRLIIELQPMAVMMENVPGLVQKGKPLFDDFIQVLEKHGYQYDFDILQVADFGVPQSRNRLVLLAGKGFTIPIPRETHSRVPNGKLKPWVAIDEVLQGLGRPCTLAEAIESGGPQAANWHVVRSLAPQNVRRIRQAKPGVSWTRIPKSLRPPCHQDKAAGFSNVYGRMQWGSVAPTITGGCTTFSKGRFGHPSEDRTISVLEAALLQTFPKSYVIDTPYMEYACNIIGNALPCKFATVVARECMKAMKARDQ